MNTSIKWPVSIEIKSGVVHLPYGDEQIQFLSLVGESNAADTLTNIMGGKPGNLVILQADADDVTITLDDSASLSLNGADIALDDQIDKVMLVCVSENTWHLIGNSQASVS